MKNILFVASEGVPFIKTGGLADVVGSLPKCIDKEYFDVRVMIPKYSCIKQELKDKMNLQEAFEQKISGGEESDRQKMDSAVVQEAAAALEALGYGRQEAWSAVRRVSGGEGMNVEKLLRAALKEMV